MVNLGFSNFKELIQMIPSIQQTAKIGIDRYNDIFPDEQTRINVEIKFYQKGLKFLKGKWTIDILCSLFFLKEAYYNELKGHIPKINTTILTDRLRYLEKQKLISRKVNSKGKIRVLYKITEYGENLFLLLLPFLFYTILPNNKKIKDKNSE